MKTRLGYRAFHFLELQKPPSNSNG